MAIPSSTIIPNNTTPVQVTSRAGCVSKIECFNNSTTGGYLKLYDSLTSPTSASTPVARIYVPPDGLELTYPDLLQIKHALWFRFTTGIADSDDTPVSANQFIVNIYA